MIATTVLAVYGLSLVPDVGFWDTAEMQTVPYILGLAHPTGYPSEILIGWMFTHLIPVGEPALRMNVLCMICVIIGAICCGLASLAFGAVPIVAVATSLCFAFSPVVWSHATHTDVTDPAVALCAVTLLLAVLAVRNNEPRCVLYSALAAGLAVGTHGIVLWFLPLPIILIVVSRQKLLTRELPRCFALAALEAAAEYAYLPLRSHIVTAQRLDPTRAIGLPPGMPFWDLGHPASWSGFVTIVAGTPVAAPNALASIFHIRRYLTFADFAWNQLLGSYPAFIAIIMLCLAVWGAWLAKAPWFFLPLVLITPFAASFSAETDVPRYYGFPLLCLWLLISIAVSKMYRSKSSAIRIVVLLGILAYPAYEVYAGRGAFLQHADTLGSRYVANVIASTDERAIIIAPWVYATPLAYASYAQGIFGSRLVVPFSVDDAGQYLAQWTKLRAVYTVSESAPKLHATVRFIRRFNVNRDFARDPKLYRIESEVK